MAINNANNPEQQRAPVYIPFKTFQTAIETLEQGMPPILDRSVWPSFSGGLQSQTLGSFKFLGLIDNSGGVKPILEKLVKAKGDDRKTVLREIIQDKYVEAIRLADQNASFQQLQDYFRTYNVKAGTLYRIVCFFLDACKYTGIKCSAHWAKAKKAPIRLSKRDDTKDTKDKILPPLQNELLKANVKTVQLRSGGTLSLTLSVDLMALSKEDRDWLFELVDRLNTYGQLQDSGK
jgi:hypothetical protein